MSEKVMKSFAKATKFDTRIDMNGPLESIKAYSLRTFNDTKHTKY